jgi:hypothetical protein
MEKCKSCVNSFKMEKWYFCEKFYCNIDDIKEGTDCEFFVDKRRF